MLRSLVGGADEVVEAFAPLRLHMGAGHRGPFATATSEPIQVNDADNEGVRKLPLVRPEVVL
eukprot:2541907-Alexandrium_andersonii.AAC.1